MRKKYLSTRGIFEDCDLYAILKEDWERNKKLPHHVGTQTLITKRLILRKFTPEERRKSMFEHVSQLPKTSPFSSDQPSYSRRETYQLFQQYILSQYKHPDFYRWCICVGETFVGNITLTMLSDTARTAEIGYTINEIVARQKESRPEAVQAVLDFAFGTVCLNRIEAHYAVDNVASGAVLMKNVECSMREKKSFVKYV